MAARKTPPPVPQPPKRTRKPAKPAPPDARPTLTRAKAQAAVVTAARQAAFLAQFSQRGLIASSARAAGVHRDTVYEWRKSDPAFAAAFDEADTLVTEAAEAEAWRRGVEGWEEPLAHQGMLTGESVRKFDSTLLTLVLKARCPEKYRERFDLAHSVAPPPSGEDARLMALIVNPDLRAAAGAVYDNLG